MANDKNFLDDMELTGSYDSDESFDLDSILAEFGGGAGKGEARSSAEAPAYEWDEPETQKAPEPELEATRQFTPVEREAEAEPEPEEPERRGLFGRRRTRRDPEPEKTREPPVRTERFVVKLHDEKPAYETRPEIDQSVFEEPEEEARDRMMEEFFNSVDDGPFHGMEEPEPEYSAPDTSRFERETGETEELGEELLEEDEGHRRSDGTGSRRPRRGIKTERIMIYVRYSGFYRNASGRPRPAGRAEAA